MPLDKSKLKELMQQHNIKNFTELAKCLGISKNQLSNILSDKFNPIKSNVIELAEFFNINPLEIILENNNMEKIIYHYAEENIFDVLDRISDGKNYTTVGAYLEDNPSISNEEKIRFSKFNEDDFLDRYSKEILTEKQLFKKLNIIKK